MVSGSGRIKLDDEVVDLQQWDVIRVAPDVVRAFEGGANGLELIAVGSDRPEGATARWSTISGWISLARIGLCLAGRRRAALCIAGAGPRRR